MSHSMIASRKFAEAYNGMSLDALENLLAEDATAQVLGTGWPEEKGSRQIRKISLSHILGLGGGTDPLVAEAWAEGEKHYVLLLDKENRTLDTAIRIHCADGGADKIQRLAYLVLGHQHQELSRIGAKAGVALKPVD